MRVCVHKMSSGHKAAEVSRTCETVVLWTSSHLFSRVCPCDPDLLTLAQCTPIDLLTLLTYTQGSKVNNLGGLAHNVTSTKGVKGST